MHKVLLTLLLCMLILSCSDPIYQPKPKGYFRLDFPEKSYELYDAECPFEFKKAENSIIQPYRDSTKKCWFDLVYPQLKASVHFSYDRLNGDFGRHIEDSRTLAYKHAVKATNIEEFFIPNDSNNTYALLYRIYGNTASSIQFFITDSTTHFLRGALYFRSAPNSDSLEPSIKYVQKDIEVILSSLRWK